MEPGCARRALGPLEFSPEAFTREEECLLDGECGGHRPQGTARASGQGWGVGAGDEGQSEQSWIPAPLGAGGVRAASHSAFVHLSFIICRTGA